MSNIDTSKKTRVMTEKGFVFKCGTKAAHSAKAFISAHREFLESGTLAPVTSPILSKFDDGELLPTPTIEALKQVVFDHMLAKEAAAIEANIGKEREPVSKNHTATIYDQNYKVLTKINSKGETEDLIKSFNLPQEAERWSDLRLFEQLAGSFAVIQHHKTNQQTVIKRESSFDGKGALSRVLAPKKNALHKTTSKTSASLKGQMKVKQDYASFSRG